jgi:hypothetical protein
VSRHRPHSRAHTRHHFVRIARKRLRTFFEVHPDAVYRDGPWDLSLGRFDDEQAYLGCHRARCGLCHPSKRWHRGADRLAAEREWRRDWADSMD